MKVNIEIGFFCDNSFCLGNVMNITENDMYIKTNGYFPHELNFEVLIPFKRDYLKVPVKFDKVVEEYGTFDAMCVKVLDPSKEYLEIVNSHRFPETNIHSQSSG